MEAVVTISAENPVLSFCPYVILNEARNLINLERKILTQDATGTLAYLEFEAIGAGSLDVALSMSGNPPKKTN